MTDLHDAHDLEDLYGPLFKYSDIKRGEKITYRDEQGKPQTGTVLWIVGAGPVVEGGKPLAMHYIVEPDENASWPETVFTSDLVRE